MDDPATLTLEEAASRLGLHYMTVYRHVRTGRLPAEYRNGRWHIDAAVLTREAPRSRRAGGGTAAATVPGPAAGSPSRLLDRLVAGDAAGSWSIVETALMAGAPLRVYTDVLGPALRSLGEGWATGRLSIADEHRATTVALGIVGRLGPLFRRRGRRRAGRVILAGVEGDSHAIPLMMVADSLEAGGFEVVNFGADVPVAELLSAAAGARDLAAVGLSVGTDLSAGRAADSISALRARIGGVPVIVGGPAVASEAAARDLGADGWGADASGAVELIEALGGHR